MQQVTSDVFCPLAYPTVGSPLSLQDFSNCGSFLSTFSHTAEFCRDLCLRSSPTCKSFSFNCGNPSLKPNCRLFSFSISDLFNRSNSGICGIESAIGDCFHEDLIQVVNDELTAACSNNRKEDFG